MSIAVNAGPVRQNLSHPVQPGVSRPALRLGSSQDSKKQILFVTSELTDLIKTGGLADVSAALPRALCARHDVRVLIPGYRKVIESGHPILTVGSLAPHAGIPGCQLGRMDMPDGLIIYVLLCPELYDRDGSPYGS
ncbi:glycogen/starch synthase, partial [Stutzerimonas balearica]